MLSSKKTGSCSFDLLRQGTVQWIEAWLEQVQVEVLGVLEIFCSGEGEELVVPSTSASSFEHPWG